MASPTMTFKRGAGTTKYFTMNSDNLAPGGTLIFTAKPDPDDDTLDSSAQIRKVFTDSAIISNADGKVKFGLPFIALDTSGILMKGEDSIKLKGDFKYTAPGIEPIIVPGDNKYIDVIVYSEIGRKNP